MNLFSEVYKKRSNRIPLIMSAIKMALPDLKGFPGKVISGDLFFVSYN
jgi:hypothetical protein